MGHTWDHVRILDANLTLEPVGISKKKTEHRSEVGDEVIGGSTGHQAVPDLFEHGERSRPEGEMVEPAPAKHGHLTVSLGISINFEDIQLAELPNHDDGERGPLPPGNSDPSLAMTASKLLSIEGLETVGVVGQSRHMLKTCGEHEFVLSLRVDLSYRKTGGQLFHQEPQLLLRAAPPYAWVAPV